MLMKSSAIALFLAAGLAACAPQVSQHGHTIDQAAIAKIVPGVTPRAEVARLLGSPSTLATFEDTRWYYVTQRREQRSFYQSQITDQHVVTISFDDRGLVQEVRQHGLEQALAVEPDADSTPTLGNELGFLEQIIGNVGRFGDPEALPGGGAPPR